MTKNSISKLIICSILCVGLLGISLYLEVFRPHQTYLWFSSRSLMLTLFLIAFITIPIRDKKMLVRVLKFPLVGLLILFFVNAVLRATNIYNYEPLPNYFYTLKLFRIITISSVFFAHTLILLGSVQLLKNTYYPTNKLLSLQAMLAILLFSYFIVHFQGALATTHSDILQTVQAADQPRNRKLEQKIGGQSIYGWIVPYTEFINAHTPEDAVILIPTQNEVWPMEGNGEYIRWFLYPRRVKHLDAQLSVPSDVTHLLIAEGECSRGKVCGWPQFDVPADKVEWYRFIDPSSRQETVFYNQPFIASESNKKWGILKLKDTND